MQRRLTIVGDFAFVTEHSEHGTRHGLISAVVFDDQNYADATTGC